MAQVGTSIRVSRLRRLLLAELTTDTASSTAYGTAIPLGLQSELTWNLEFVKSDLKYAGGTAESDNYLDYINWSLKHGEIDLAALAMQLGGATVNVAESTGGAGDSKALFYYTNALKGKYFGILGQPYTAAGGPADFYVVLMKCKLESLQPGNMSSSNWAEVSMGGRGFYTAKDSALWGIATLEKQTDQTFSVVLTDLASFLA